MQAKSALEYLFIACAALLIFAACRSPAPNHNRIEPSILLVGNSFTAINGGIAQQLKSLVPTGNIASVAPGGYTLAKHWNDENTRQTIRDRQWKYVVLQEQSQTPIFDLAKFREFAGALDQEIKRGGAKTILFMTWERPDSVAYGVTTTNLAAAYESVGADLGAKVAPVGLAFARSLRERPELSLYTQDGHPTLQGTYLAACVLYSTIFEQSPVGKSSPDESLAADVQTYLQKIAAESLGYSSSSRRSHSAKSINSLSEPRGV